MQSSLCASTLSTKNNSASMTMPYNTRRKSLSLPALGVQVPGRAHSHRGSVDLKNDASTADRERQTTDAQSSPPAKRVKRSHSPSTSTAASPTSQRPSSSGAQTKSPARPKSRNVEYTPPPSPPATNELTIDYDSINDDIVEGVVRQLESTGNRPHLIKELAAVLSRSHDSVMTSANAPALLSSRLANYMKRPCWNSSKPCLVGKELIPIHPRKVFYYLTDRQRQTLPANSDDIYGPLGITDPIRTTPSAATPTAVAEPGAMGPPPQLPMKRSFAPSFMGGGYNVSPPLSNASVAEDDNDNENDEFRGRFAMSPSPEVDLSMPNADYEQGEEEQDASQATHSSTESVKREFSMTPSDTSSQPSSYTSARSSLPRDLERPEPPARDLSLNTRANGPKLECVEREFTDTARSFREKSEANTPVDGGRPDFGTKMEVVKEEPSQEGDERKYRDELFAQQGPKQDFVMSSPAFQPQRDVKQQSMASINDVVMTDPDMVITGGGMYRWELEAMTDIAVDELDTLLSGSQ